MFLTCSVVNNEDPAKSGHVDNASIDFIYVRDPASQISKRSLSTNVRDYTCAYMCPVSVGTQRPRPARMQTRAQALLENPIFMKSAAPLVSTPKGVWLESNL